MKPHIIAGPITGALLVLGTCAWVGTQVSAAGKRMQNPETPAPAVAVADHAEAPYCTPAFKQVLQRVLNACGLVGSGSRRGCKPSDVKSLASISDEDFNALFLPLKERGGIVLYDEGKETLDDAAKRLVEDRWADRKGARYFFVVSRGSKSGTVEQNRSISHKRANSVLFHVSEVTKEPDLEKQVGLLWLGKEYAQLSKDFCQWKTSRDGKCDENAVNRSAFISWVDCRL